MQPFVWAEVMRYGLEVQETPGAAADRIIEIRNGKAIDLSRDKNYLLSGSGHLMIVSARFSDAGNYSCRAENVAGVRNSPLATLTVYGRTQQDKPKQHY